MTHKDHAASTTNLVALKKSKSNTINTSNIPLYKQLATQLKQEITHNYKVGDTLLAESTLAKDLGVNRHTVHRAINELMLEGYVRCQKGKRAEVLDRQLLKYALAMGKFTAGMQRLGKQSTTEVLMTQTIHPVSADFKKLFNLTCAAQETFLQEAQEDSRLKNKVTHERLQGEEKTNLEQLILIRTLRRVDGQPISMIDHYLNPTYVPDIAKRYQQGSLHSFIKEHYGYELLRKNAQISARLPELNEANHLQCHSQQPLIIVDSVHSNKQNLNQVIEVSVSHTRADKMTITI